MAQGVGSVLGGPIAALLHQSTGSWIPVFAVIITMDFVTAALAICALKPMRRRWLVRRSAVVSINAKESGISTQHSGLGQVHVVSRRGLSS